MRAMLLFVAGVTYGLCASCGSAKPDVDYAGVASACTLLKQAVVDAHGEEATAQDGLDFQAVREVCARRLDELDNEDGGQ